MDLKMKNIIFMAVLFSCGLQSLAQDFMDNALLFSRTRAGGSARIQALGGAQVSLGGDYSSALSNPAGLGMFNRSEFTLSTGLGIHNTSSDYFGINTDDSRTVFNIPGISLVYHHETGKDEGFLGGSFSISMTRVNDFNHNFTYRGTNSENSIVDYFIDDAYGVDPNSMLWDQNGPGDNFFTLTGLAYNNYLIEGFDEGGTFVYKSVLSPLPAEPGFPAEIRTIDQQEISKAKGAQNQWSISYGANFNDKLFLGGGIGITSIRFKLRQVFRESNFRYSEDPDYNPIDYFQTEEDFDTRGTGINLTLGAIYRPVDFIQLGASFVTPTYYDITDNYTARIESFWNIYNDSDNESFPDQRDVFEEFGEPLISEYSLTTPMRLNTGVVFISRFGFITADAEFVNYSKAKYRSDIDEDFDAENQDIKAGYQPVVNYRVGAEYRYQLYRIRAGYNYMPDPFRVNDDVDQRIQSFSGGVGIRTKEFYIDFATIFSTTNRRRAPYFVNGNDPISYQRFKTTNFVVTVGFTF
jgi:hypothetical protein